MSITNTLSAQLDKLAAFEPSPFPVVSLYLDLQPDHHGRDRFETFIGKELTERMKTYGAEEPEGQSLGADGEKIRAYVDNVDKAASGLAVFACSGARFFETVVLSAPVEAHRLCISDQPHLYPLAHIVDAHPRYAVLLADTNSSRIFVISAHTIEKTEEIQGTKTRGHKAGGLSQPRYQRHIENYHRRHVKEVADTLAKLVRTEEISGIIVSGDPVVLPLLREQFHKEVADKVVDVVSLDAHAQERDVLETAEALWRAKDADTDRERVDTLLGAYRGNGLATAGVENTKVALEMGQVDELVIAAIPDVFQSSPVKAARVVETTGSSSAQAPGPTAEERTADELVTKARQTSARLRFIEDPSLLEPVGGVGAFLRFKL